MPAMNHSMASDRETAHARIRSLILGGGLDPDAPVSERQLAERLGLGRTPVREALKSLARDGLLDVIPMRGTFLRQPSIEEVREIYEVRLALEGMATVLVAERGAPPELRRFRTRLADLQDRTDAAAIERMHRIGWDFHEAIVTATGNRRMRRMYEALRMPIMALRSGRPVDAAQARRSLIEHLAILDAIEAGDGAGAQRRMTEHLTTVLEARVRLQASGVLSAAAINPPRAPARPEKRQSETRKRRG